MTFAEPIPTAFLLTAFGVLMAVSVVFSRALERLGVPIVLLFLVLGMLAGSEGIGGIDFSDYQFAFRVGMVALVLILFDGGMNTPLSSVRAGLVPAALLSTVGVVMTAALAAVGAYLIGVRWEIALLLGAVISSTDAATVFAVLRGSRLNLHRRVGVTLELESGMNDPMAVILTMAITHSLIAGEPLSWMVVLTAPLQMAIGLGLGIGFGFAGVALLQRVRLLAGGLYSVLTLAIALLAFGVATLAYGSGFLAVYAVAVVIGNSSIPYRNGLTRIHDALAWMGQLTMFLMLGLLVFPSQLVGVWWAGLGIALFLTLVARPIAVFLCLAPFRYPVREKSYIAWVGLSGAVPIILATIPVLSNVPHALDVFNVVFFVVVLKALIPGSTVLWLTRWMKLDVAEPPPPAAMLEINSNQILGGEILTFFIDDSLAVSNVPLSRIAFPRGSAAILVVRGTELLAARGDTVLMPGDHVYVFIRPEDKPYIQLLFGKPEEP